VLFCACLFDFFLLYFVCSVVLFGGSGFWCYFCTHCVVPLTGFLLFVFFLVLFGVLFCCSVDACSFGSYSDDRCSVLSRFVFY